MHCLRVFIACSIAASALPAATASQAVKTAESTGNISFTSTPNPAELYASGSDDPFAEYGIATYNFTPDDFGQTPLTDIASVSWLLTQNGRGFSASGPVEFFYSPDDFDADYTGLTYDNLEVGGVSAPEFTSLFSLGTQDYESRDVFGGDPEIFPPGGEKDDYELSFTGAALASLIAEINSGSDFQLIIAAAEITTTATYSGNDNFFDPGDPELTISLAADGLLGDFNDDLTVDGGDLVVWENTVGSTTDLRADADGDNDVDVSDVLVWQREFGNTSLPAVSAVPEPTIGVLLSVAAIALLTRRG